MRLCATVTLVDELNDPKAAETVVLPPARAVPKPLAVTVATVELPVLQLADAVRSWVEWSLKDPTAVNCRESPGARFGLAGLIVIDCACGLQIPALKAL